MLKYVKIKTNAPFGRQYHPNQIVSLSKESEQNMPIKTFTPKQINKLQEHSAFANINEYLLSFTNKFKEGQK